MMPVPPAGPQSVPPALFVTGASGLIGRALAQARPIVPLPRRDPGDGSPWWDPEAGAVHDAGASVAAVVHLAGESVAGSRWNAQTRAAILDSRVQGSRTLVDWIAARSQRPSVLIAASAVGIYGDRAEERLTEASAVGDGFLAEVTRKWEEEVQRAEDAGVRVVLLRLGVVLSTEGGALPKMLPAFRAGVGGPVGSGRQWFPWVDMADVVGVIEWALKTPGARGPYNVVAPGVLRQKDFATALGRQLHRPAFLPAPAFAMRLLFGGLADEGLLASQRVEPARLLEQGYRFSRPEVSASLAALLG